MGNRFMNLTEERKFWCLKSWLMHMERALQRILDCCYLCYFYSTFTENDLLRKKKSETEWENDCYLTFQSLLSYKLLPFFFLPFGLLLITGFDSPACRPFLSYTDNPACWIEYWKAFIVPIWHFQCETNIVLKAIVLKSLHLQKPLSLEGFSIKSKNLPSLGFWRFVVA